jgi:hypothetical protein
MNETFRFFNLLEVPECWLEVSTYPEDPATIPTQGFLVFLCHQANTGVVSRCQVATECISGSRPDLNSLLLQIMQLAINEKTRIP